MPKVGNYVQRDYHNRFSSKRNSTWSDYNRAWNERRAGALEKSTQLRNVASTFMTIGVQASQANTALLMQNRNAGAYANPTAVMARVNVVI